ncbi:hypothetical protein RHECNPAF_13300177 [Rhizobium etli CNPAF512]|nr:hypothetical protein RHECNPAF_13300177 [Rhizobium etli CNPAF512]
MLPHNACRDRAFAGGDTVSVSPQRVTRAAS